MKEPVAQSPVWTDKSKSKSKPLYSFIRLKRASSLVAGIERLLTESAASSTSGPRHLVGSCVAGRTRCALLKPLCAVPAVPKSHGARLAGHAGSVVLLPSIALGWKNITHKMKIEMSTFVQFTYPSQERSWR
jgi:hypothetical protein